MLLPSFTDILFFKVLIEAEDVHVVLAHTPPIVI